MIDFPVIDSHIHLLDQKRFGYAWASGAPALKRDWTPDDLAACAKPYQDRRLRLRRGRCRHAAISRRGGLGERVSPNATGACSAPSPACRWSAAEAIEPEIARIAELPITRGVRRLIQNQPDPGLRAAAGLSRRAQAAAEIQSVLRHLHLSSPAAQHAGDGSPLSRGRLCARPHRQARHQGGAEGSVAQANPGTGALAQRCLQAVRSHDRGRSQGVDARATAPLHRSRRRLLRRRSHPLRRRLAGLGARRPLCAMARSARLGDFGLYVGKTSASCSATTRSKRIG